MNTQHTPGPWNVGDDSPNEYEGPTIENIDTVVAVIPIDDINDSSPEERANARLIAAAPDLLDACQHLLEMVAECQLNGVLPDAKKWPAAQAAAAITKATGGQP